LLIQTTTVVVLHIELSAFHILLQLEHFLFLTFIVRIAIDTLLHTVVVVAVVLTVIRVEVVFQNTRRDSREFLCGCNKRKANVEHSRPLTILIIVIFAVALVVQEHFALILVLLLHGFKVRFHEGTHTDDVVTVSCSAASRLFGRARVRRAQTETDQVLGGDFDNVFTIGISVPLLDRGTSLLKTTTKERTR